MKLSAGCVGLFVVVAGCSSDNSASSSGSSSEPILTQYSKRVAPHTDAGGAVEAGTITPKTCVGSSLMQHLGKSRLLVGATMSDASAAAAPFDFRYLYVAGPLLDPTSCAMCPTTCGAWWGCWQADTTPAGQLVRAFIASAQANQQIPMITYDSLLQASGVAEGTAEATQAATDVSFMTRYLADFRFMLQQIGGTEVFLHLEPDFWGYAQRASPDPHASAAVASANPTDCGGYENSIAGMGQCMIAMTRKYAPNALVGLHASPWSTGVDVAFNTSPSLDVAAEAQKAAAFLVACGADKSDFVVVEASDRDAGYYDSIGENRWWDSKNATLPTFHQDLAWARALADAAQKPLFEWQIPVGNMTLPNTSGAWRDNRLDYFFAHMDELAAAHVFAVGFGAGWSGMTTPETDGGNLIAKEKAYAASGGQPFCP